MAVDAFESITFRTGVGIPMPTIQVSYFRDIFGVAVLRCKPQHCLPACPALG